MPQRIVLFTLTILLFLLAPPAGGQSPAEMIGFPTVAQIEQTTIPYADPVELARMLRHIDVDAVTISDPAVRHLGERESLWATNESLAITFQVPAILSAIGDHVYLWVEEGVNIAEADLKALVQAFDTRIYHQVRDLWGSEASPGVDGDPRLHILFTYDLGPGTAAYFARRHTFPDEIFPQSNTREMFFVNLDVFGTRIATRGIESTLAHEFQHMIRANLNPNEDTWLNEGFSTFTELYLGYTTPLYQAQAYLAIPGTQLNTFAYNSPSRGADYGAAMLFVTYFYERYGIDALRNISTSTTNGLSSFERVLYEMGEPGVDAFFADWVVANVVQNRQIGVGHYGYNMIGRLPVHIREEIAVYPVEWTASVNQYAVDYYSLTGLDSYETLEITFSMPHEVQLIPTNSPGGDWMWYSNRADASHMTLTRAFDLREVESATLHYDVWYQIEEDWDYAYLMVSTDDGETWDIMSTPETTSSNPFGNAYGPGYSGESTRWVEEEVSLDVYAGQEIIVRFALITDDAINLPGMAIDSVGLPEIDYTSDFEFDGGGWEANGWVRIDNRLPQQAWVQAIQYAGDTVDVARWLAPGPSWMLPLVDDVERVVIAVSPFAPMTTISAPYQLKVDAR